VDGATQQLLDALPPPVRDGAVVVGKGVAVVADAAVEHPLAAGVVVAAVAVPTGVKWYQARYGGYAGELTPQQVGIVAGLQLSGGRMTLDFVAPCSMIIVCLLWAAPGCLGIALVG
jgi:hypothetical protein